MFQQEKSECRNTNHQVFAHHEYIYIYLIVSSDQLSTQNVPVILNCFKIFKLLLPLQISFFENLIQIIDLREVLRRATEEGLETILSRTSN